MSMAARLGDTTAHGGTVTVGCPTVLIGSMPAARIGDMQVCPMTTGPIPHVGGPIVMGAFTVLTGGVPQARQSDMAVCVGPPSMVAMGAPTVMVGMAGGGGGGGPLGALLGAAVSLGRSLLSDAATAHRLPDGSWETRVGALKIKGDPWFQARAVRDVNAIRATRSGRALMRSLSKSGRTVTVEFDADGEGARASALQEKKGAVQGILGADGAAGPPANVRIIYDPDLTTLAAPGTDYEHATWANPPNAPPDVVLFHELVHADDFTHGRADMSKGPNTGPRAAGRVAHAELRAVGLPPHEQSAFNENTYRAERGLPRRDFY